MLKVHKTSFKELLYLISFRKHSKFRIIDRECHAAARASISARPSPRPLTLAVEIHFPAHDEARLTLSLIKSCQLESAFTETS